MDRVDRRRTTSRPRAHSAVNGHRGSPGSDEEDVEVQTPPLSPEWYCISYRLTRSGFRRRSSPLKGREPPLASDPVWTFQSLR